MKYLMVYDLERILSLMEKLIFPRIFAFITNFYIPNYFSTYDKNEINK